MRVVLHSTIGAAITEDPSDVHRIAHTHIGPVIII